MVQLSYLYMTTGETIALSIWTFVALKENECGSRPNHLYTRCFQKGYLLLNVLTSDSTYSLQLILLLSILNSLGSYLTTSLKFIFSPYLEANPLKTRTLSFMLYQCFFLSLLNGFKVCFHKILDVIFSSFIIKICKMRYLLHFHLPQNKLPFPKYFDFSTKEPKLISLATYMA